MKANDICKSAPLPQKHLEVFVLQFGQFGVYLFTFVLSQKDVDCVGCVTFWSFSVWRLVT